MLEPGLQPLIVYSSVLQDLFSLGTGDGLLLKSQNHHSGTIHCYICLLLHCMWLFFSYLVKDIIHSDYITLYCLTYLNVNECTTLFHSTYRSQGRIWWRNVSWLASSVFFKMCWLFLVTQGSYCWKLLSDLSKGLLLFLFCVLSFPRETAMHFSEFIFHWHLVKKEVGC